MNCVRPFAGIGRRYFRRIVFSAFAALALVLCSCAKPHPRADLVFLNGAEPETLDPALITGQPEGRIANALFEGLTASNAAAQPVPGVAERWDLSNDKRVYTFHLRADARWSNGEAVTAEDFVRSWQRTLAPETASEYAYQLYYIENGKAFNEGTLKDFSQVGVHALDARTLQVTLENPTPFFLDLCAFSTLLPVHLPSVLRFGDDWIKPGKMISNGAYQLAEWRVNDRVTLVKNPFYWNSAHVAMRSIDVFPSARANTAFNYYSTGLADLMMDKGLAPTPLMGELKKRADFHSAPFLGNYFIRFNASRAPFNDPRVRKAFALVIDKNLLVEKITKAGEVPAQSLVPPGTAGYEPPPGPARDPAHARQLLAEAGFPEGKNFPLVSYLYKGDSDLDRDLAVELQGMFQRELGVSVQLQGQEWKVYLRSMSSLDFDLCRSSWVGDYNDPNTFLDMFVTGGGNNRTGWASPDYDALIAAAARELDETRRFDIFRSAERLLITDAAPICPLYFYVGIQFYDGTRLGGIEANLLDDHPLREMFWKTPR
ncbi:MAG: oligopeptide transport system substrate-binding protein [Chthoniobacter sp.]|jgi:oligopeptide transport system substrate-binding protein|nr:oligopeptide transport system substrate-binding protein [Chthoniobacter sp.]